MHSLVVVDRLVVDVKVAQADAVLYQEIDVQRVVFEIVFVDSCRFFEPARSSKQGAENGSTNSPSSSTHRLVSPGFGSPWSMHVASSTVFQLLSMHMVEVNS